jgi:hypothetical protein
MGIVGEYVGSETKQQSFIWRAQFFSGAADLPG